MRRAGAFIIVALLLAACGAGNGTERSTQASVAATVPTTPAPSASAAASTRPDRQAVIERLTALGYDCGSMPSDTPQINCPKGGAADIGVEAAFDQRGTLIGIALATDERATIDAILTEYAGSAIMAWANNTIDALLTTPPASPPFDLLGCRTFPSWVATVNSAMGGSRTLYLAALHSRTEPDSWCLDQANMAFSGVDYVNPLSQVQHAAASARLSTSAPQLTRLGELPASDLLRPGAVVWRVAEIDPARLVLVSPPLDGNPGAYEPFIPAGQELPDAICGVLDVSGDPLLRDVCYIYIQPTGNGTLTMSGAYAGTFTIPVGGDCLGGAGFASASGTLKDGRVASLLIQSSDDGTLGVALAIDGVAKADAPRGSGTYQYSESSGSFTATIELAEGGSLAIKGTVGCAVLTGP